MNVVAQLPGSAEYRAKHAEHFKERRAVAGSSSPAGASRQCRATHACSTRSSHRRSWYAYGALQRHDSSLVPFGLKGAIWYQGESNHAEGFAYVDKTAALLHSWRTAFQNPNLPFYYVQIAPWQYGDEDPEILPQFWIAQQQCMQLPHTGMAVITDIAELQDIHPAKKQEVARRLSLWALAKDLRSVGYRSQRSHVRLAQNRRFNDSR